MPRGQIHLYTGDGKGKTTAAIGLAVRALGAHQRVAMVQFMKDGHSHEIEGLRCIGGACFDYFGVWDRSFIIHRPNPMQYRMAREVFDYFAGLIQSDVWDMIIADEVCVAIAMGLLSCEELVTLLQARNPTCEIILTGQGAPQELYAIADLITTMQCTKHYYDQGIPAREGIEY